MLVFLKTKSQEFTVPGSQTHHSSRNAPPLSRRGRSPTALPYIVDASAHFIWILDSILFGGKHPFHFYTGFRFIWKYIYPYKTEPSIQLKWMPASVSFGHWIPFNLDTDFRLIWKPVYNILDNGFHLMWTAAFE